MTTREEFMTGNRTMILENAFHKHLDECKQCNGNPFQLCLLGELLLKSAVQLSLSDITQSEKST